MTQDQIGILREASKEAIILRLRLEVNKVGATKAAELTGIHRNNFYQALDDGANPSIETVIKIAAAFGYGLRLHKFTGEMLEPVSEKPSDRVRA